MHPDRKHIYEVAIQKMVTESLQEQEVRFALQHEHDTDEELLGYLRKCTAQLRHPPHPKEIAGWQYILSRFETWEKALLQAGIHRPYTPNTPSKFQRIIEETELQQKIYRQKKAEKKQKHQQRLHQQAQRKRLRAKEAEPAEI